MGSASSPMMRPRRAGTLRCRGRLEQEARRKPPAARPMRTWPQAGSCAVASFLYCRGSLPYVSLLIVDFDRIGVLPEVRRSGRRAPRDGSRGLDDRIDCSFFAYPKPPRTGGSFREGFPAGPTESPLSRVGTVSRP